MLRTSTARPAAALALLAILLACTWNLSPPRQPVDTSLLLRDRRLGDYEPFSLDVEVGLFRGSSYWWFATFDADVMKAGPLHDLGEPRGCGCYRRVDGKGTCTVEVARHGEKCQSRRLGLLVHDMQLVFYAGTHGRKLPETARIGEQVVGVRFSENEKAMWAEVGWVSPDHHTVMMEFSEDHERRPDIAAEPIVSAYLRRYPSTLTEEFARLDLVAARRREADKALAWGALVVFVGMTYYPSFVEPWLSAGTFTREQLEAWWKKNRDRCPQELRLELMDAALEELARKEGQKMRYGQPLSERMRDCLPWIVSEALGSEPRDDLRGRHAFWKSWWQDNRHRRLSEQWADLLDRYLARLHKPSPELGVAILRIQELAQRGVTPLGGPPVGPPGFETKSMHDPQLQDAIIQAWRSWWKDNKGKFVPELVRQAEREFAEECSCGKHK